MPQSHFLLRQMHIPKQQRAEYIDRLDIRDEVKRLLNGTLEIGPFQGYFSEPSYFYSQGHPDNPGHWPTFTKRTLLPLWQRDDKIYAFDVACDPAEVISWSIECPDEFQIAPSLDAAIFDMIDLHVWEYGGGKHEAAEAMQFAKQIALPNLENLATLLADVELSSAEMIAEHRSSL